MPPDPKQDQPGPDASSSSGPIDDRMAAVEAEQKRQGGILERIEQALAGGKNTPGRTDPDQDGKPIAELVREGVEQLRREEQAQADADAERAQREDHATRLAALEERQPSETAATPVGRLRAAAQRWGFGIDEQHK